MTKAITITYNDMIKILETLNKCAHDTSVEEEITIVTEDITSEKRTVNILFDTQINGVGGVFKVKV